MSEWINVPPHRVLKASRSEFIDGFDVVYAESGSREAVTSQALNATYPDQIAFYVRNADRRRFRRAQHRPFEEGDWIFLEEI